MKEYFVRRKSSGDYWEPPNLESTSRQVIETEELIDTGILDENGNRVMAKERKEPIGFIRFR